jgi:hypothetical protein
MVTPLSLTPRFSEVIKDRHILRSRFNGFTNKPLKRFPIATRRCLTSLKRGVNEKQPRSGVAFTIHG